MPYVTLRGARHYYELHGSGPPLLLVAGMGGACTYWSEQVEAFARAYRVVLYDQRGTGRSDHTLVESIEQLAADALALLDALGIERVHFLGHSTGGAVGQVLAIEQPERLHRLVVHASVARSDPYRERVWGLRLAVLERLGAGAYAATTSIFLYPPWWIAAHHERLAQEERRAAGMLSDPKIMGSRIAAILEFDRSAELSQVRVPTLVLCARDDILTPPHFSEEIARLIPGAKLVLMERGGHACARSMPEEFNRLVLDFLD